MSIRIKSAATLALLALSLSAPAQAAESGGLHAKGSIESTVLVGKATNIAKGTGSKASISIGSFHSDTKLNRSVRQTIVVKRVFNISKDKNSPACLKVGSYGKSAICR